MERKLTEDYLWLTSAEASETLRLAMRLIAEKTNPLKTAKRLRQSMSPERSAIVMEQANLRIRGRRKFDLADQMFFSGKSLEQSTSTLIANYKRRRFDGCNRVADICCGIGGDLISLAQRQTESSAPETVGVEKDLLTAHLANANIDALQIENARVIDSAFEDFDISPFDGLHFDPDRRVKNRTTQGNLFAPSLAQIFQELNHQQQRVAIKIAPATEVQHVELPCEREWIGDWRECKQQVLWSGAGIEANTRRATVVAKDGTFFQFQHSGEPIAAAPVVENIPKYIYEPHAAILAARLQHALAEGHQLRPISRGVGYLCGDSLLEGVEPLLKGYRIEEVLPADLKLIQKKLNAMDVGQMVLKTRGVDQVLSNRIARLKLKGQEKATVILTRHQGSRRALLVTRVEHQSGGRAH